MQEALEHQLKLEHHPPQEVADPGYQDQGYQNQGYDPNNQQFGQPSGNMPPKVLLAQTLAPELTSVLGSATSLISGQMASTVALKGQEMANQQQQQAATSKLTVEQASLALMNSAPPPKPLSSDQLLAQNAAKFAAQNAPTAPPTAPNVPTPSMPATTSENLTPVGSPAGGPLAGSASPGSSAMA